MADMSLQWDWALHFIKIHNETRHPSALLNFLLLFLVFDVYKCGIPALWILIHFLGER